MDTRNKERYNERGFTLIELLAVIVVLAIVMLIGVNAILPQMDDARKRAFSIEVNGLVTSAQQWFVTAQLTDGIVINAGETHCVSVDDLITAGQSDLKKDSGYSGCVEISKSGNLFLYNAKLKNKSYQTKLTATVNGGQNKSATIDDVTKKEKENKYICSNDKCIEEPDKPAA